MTQAQLIQFLTGVPFSLPNMWRPCYYLADGFISFKILSLIINNIYVSYLIVLFLDFYKKTYTSKKTEKADKKAAGKAE